MKHIIEIILINFYLFNYISLNTYFIRERINESGGIAFVCHYSCEIWLVLSSQSERLVVLIINLSRININISLNIWKSNYWANSWCYKHAFHVAREIFINAGRLAKSSTSSTSSCVSPRLRRYPVKTSTWVTRCSGSAHRSDGSPEAFIVLQVYCDCPGIGRPQRRFDCLEADHRIFRQDFSRGCSRTISGNVLFRPETLQ